VRHLFTTLWQAGHVSVIITDLQPVLLPEYLTSSASKYTSYHTSVSSVVVFQFQLNFLITRFFKLLLSFSFYQLLLWFFSFSFSFSSRHG